MTISTNFNQTSFKQTPIRRAIGAAINTTLVGACLLSGITQAQTFEFAASQDTHISQSQSNVNYEHATQLRLGTSENVQRILLNFDLSALQGQVWRDDIESAMITLKVSDNDGNWSEDTTGDVEIHKIGTDWNSTNATWQCDQDLNLANSQSDCANLWSGAANNLSAFDSVDVQNDTSGVIVLDVTTQVKSLFSGSQDEVQNQLSFMRH